MSFTTKKEARTYFQDTRSRLSLSEREEFSSLITSKLLSFINWEMCRVVMAYSSLKSEVSTHKLIDSLLQKGKVVVLPVTIKSERQIKPYVITDRSLFKRGAYNIKEPDIAISKSCSPSDIDLCIVPGLGYDESGFRIGFGKGYYDSFLQNLSPGCLKVGLAFSVQIVDKLPIQKWDIPVDAIITEKRIISIIRKQIIIKDR